MKLAVYDTALTIVVVSFWSIQFPSVAWIIWLSVAFWYGCGVVAYGLTFGYFMGEYPELMFVFERKWRDLALQVSSLGCAGLAIALFHGHGKHGAKYRW